jgi:hypothetical protein
MSRAVKLAALVFHVAATTMPVLATALGGSRMASFSKIGFSLVLAVTALAGCSGGASTVKGCSTDDACGATGRCLAATCVADTPPVAAIARPGALATFELVSLDGSASADADPGDAITDHAWTITSLDAPCTPPVIADAAETARVRFACAGRYELSLVVRDAKGVASAPAVETITVVDRSGSPLVSAGADVVVAHACSEGRCAPVDPIAMAAAVTGPTSGAARYLWTVEPPPDRPLGPTRRVTLGPSADVAAPEVAIETDDDAISGDWVFRVEVRDDAGLIGTAATRVSVTNRPPVITGVAPETVPHAFDAAAARFTASGAITGVSVTDPDGDPIPARSVSWVHANDGEGVFEGEDLGEAVTFRVAVSSGSPADAQHLIGGAELERAVRLAATDVNGAEELLLVPVVVGNRPPVFIAGSSNGFVITGHSFDAVQLRYRATASVGRWSDPDGDPLAQGAPTGDDDCDTLALLPDGTAVVSCSRAYTGTPAVDQFAHARQLAVSVRDPWAEAAASQAVTLTVTNRPPVAENVSVTEAVVCAQDRDYCCRENGTTGYCYAYATATATTAYSFSPRVTDPDGDPVEVRLPITASPGTLVCTGASCPAASATLPASSDCSTTSAAMPSTAITFTATDGDATSTGSHTATAACR